MNRRYPLCEQSLRPLFHFLFLASSCRSALRVTLTWAVLRVLSRTSRACSQASAARLRIACRSSLVSFFTERAKSRVGLVANSILAHRFTLALLRRFASFHNLIATPSRPNVAAHGAS